MPQRIFVTGGSGFVGSSVIRQLVARGYAVNALVNQRELPNLGGDVRSCKGGLFDAASVNEAMAGCVAALHLVGIIFENPARGITFEKMHVEGTRAVVDAAVRQGIRRYVQMSALGTRPNAVSDYHKTKWRAEELVRASGLDWTIFRPSMIHGPDGQFMQLEAKWARKAAAPYLFMPWFGGGLLGLRGAGMLQPVYVEDVARAFVDAIENSRTIAKTYELAGDQRLTWPQMHQLAARQFTGKTRLTIPIPAWYAKALAAILPARLLPFNRDQVIMSQEDNVADMKPFEADFGWTPRGLADTLAQYARLMK